MSRAQCKEMPDEGKLTVSAFNEFAVNAATSVQSVTDEFEAVRAICNFVC